MAAEQLPYGGTAKTFHLAVAAVLAVQLPLGWLMPDIRRGMTPGDAMTLHISVGLLVLLLVVLRFLWRLTHPVAPESSLPAWQRISSEFVHWLLYLAVLLTTLSGWFFASARGWSVSVFWLLAMPRLVAQNSPLGRELGGWHALMGWILLILIGVHIAAALMHLLVYKDRVMARMLPR